MLAKQTPLSFLYKINQSQQVVQKKSNNHDFCKSELLIRYYTSKPQTVNRY